jgi:hypothetical protein
VPDDVVPGLVLGSVTAALVATMIARNGVDVWLTAGASQPLHGHNHPDLNDTIEISVRDRHHQVVDLQGQRWLLRH